MDVINQSYRRTQLLSVFLSASTESVGSQSNHDTGVYGLIDGYGMR